MDDVKKLIAELLPERLHNIHGDISGRDALERLYAENADLRADLERVQADAVAMRDALEESLALNINWSTLTDEETLHHLSEYRSVILQGETALSGKAGADLLDEVKRLREMRERLKGIASKINGDMTPLDIESLSEEIDAALGKGVRRMTVMPCQCGTTHAPHVAHIRYADDVQAWQVHCLRCRMSGPLMPAEADAIRAWNRLSLSVQIAEAAWLGRETTIAAQSCRRGSSVSHPGPTLERAAAGVAQMMGNMLDEWGEDGQGDAS